MLVIYAHEKRSRSSQPVLLEWSALSVQTFLYASALGNGELHRSGIIFPASSTVNGPTLSARQLDGPTSAKIGVLGLDIPKTLDNLEGPDRADLLNATRSAIEHLAGLASAAHSAGV